MSLGPARALRKVLGDPAFKVTDPKSGFLTQINKIAFGFYMNASVATIINLLVNKMTRFVAWSEIPALLELPGVWEFVWVT